MDRQMDREEHEMDQIDNMMDMGFPRFPFPPFGPGGPPQYGAGASNLPFFLAATAAAVTAASRARLRIAIICVAGQRTKIKTYLYVHW